MSVRIICGDALDQLRLLPDESVHMCCTSPPYYGLRDYGVDGQIGLEPSPDEYVAALVAVFREVKRVLRNDGTLWLNIGDSYAGSWGAQGHRITESDEPSWHSSQIKNHPKRASNTGSIRSPGLKQKDLIGIPWLLAFALRNDGWWLRSDIIWSKPNPMPESVTDRPTKAHEYLFLLSRSERYYYDAGAIKEDSITEDPRRPYTSEGAWQLDGRPADQRHGGKPRAAGNKSHKYVAAYEASDTEEHRTKAGLMAVADIPWLSRNKRSVWTVATAPYSGAHFATFPPALIEPCILAGSSTETCKTCGAAWRMLPPESGLILDGIEVTPAKLTRSWCGHDAPSGPPPVVLDPFGGAGTTGLVADRLCRNALVIELNPAYAEMARRRIRGDAPLLTEVA
jgi:DNA modification methylase